MRAICTLLAIMICGLPATAQEATFSTRQLTPETALKAAQARAYKLQNKRLPSRCRHR